MVGEDFFLSRLCLVILIINAIVIIFINDGDLDNYALVVFILALDVWGP